MKSDMTLLLKQIYLADKLAEVAHFNDRRWDGTMYVEHPRAVAEKAFRAAVDGGMGDLDAGTVKVAGLLHDVVEDTPVTAEVIQRTFGHHVARTVLLLTRPSHEYVGKDAAQRIYLAQLASGDVREVLVKLADVWHNASTPAARRERAAAWVYGSAYPTLETISRWLETWSGTLPPQLLVSIQKLYGEAREATDRLLASAQLKTV